MSPIVIIAAVGLVALAGAIALVYVVGRGTEHRSRVVWLCVGFVLALLAAAVFLNVVSAYYKPPALLIAGLAVAGLAVVALFVVIGREVRWRWTKMLALVGLFFTTNAAIAALGMSGFGGSAVQPLFRTRAAQIAEENGFVALLPASQELRTDYQPVEPLPEDDPGLTLSYDDFQLQERKAPGPMTEADLVALVAPGERPMGADSPPVVSGAVVTTHTFEGRPAVAVEYAIDRGGGPSDPPSKRERIVVLVLEVDGVDVRFASEGGERESAGEWVAFDALGVEDLLAIAADLEPVE